MTTFEESTTRDYRALLVMLQASYAAIERRARDARSAGNREAEAIARIALAHLLESTLQALNSHVDAAILICHNSVSEGATVKGTRLHRGERMKALEDHFSFDGSGLPGWDAVKQTNDQANAIKHRLGITYRAVEGGRLAIEDDVTLSEPELLLRLDEVHDWILALGRKCGLVPPAAT